jgi:hypothetical protein
MKTTNSLMKMATRSVLGFALLAMFGLGLAMPTPAQHRQERSALRAIPVLRVVDGTESNGGKGGNPKKRQLAHVA